MGRTLNFIVCENLLPEFEAAVKGLDSCDVAVTAYDSLCDRKDMKLETAELLRHRLDSGCDCVLVCGKNCDAVKMAEESRYFKVAASDFCFSHLADRRVVQYMQSKGDYLISAGWLKNWRRHLARMGFDQVTARSFYKDFCRGLVFFDMDGKNDPHGELAALSEYLDMPCQSIRTDSNAVDGVVRDIVSEWRLVNCAKDAEKASADAAALCAEYASVMEILGSMSSCQNRGEAIEKLRGIFTMLMGASTAIFYDKETNYEGLPEDGAPLLSDPRKKYVYIKEESRFYISVTNDETVFGVVEASGFMFPQYIRRYLNFAIGMSRICGLVFSNIENYARLAKSQKDLKLKSYQDPLTGLNNRAFYYDLTDEGMIENIGKYENMAVFSFDIDGLKYVNDNYGHLEGDKLIVAASSILRKCFRGSDSVVRMGGDEFLALIPDCGGMDEAELIKERICRAVAGYNAQVAEEYLKVELSVGYAVKGDRTETAQDMLNRADAMMYRDKTGKRAQR